MAASVRAEARETLFAGQCFVCREPADGIWSDHMILLCEGACWDLAIGLAWDYTNSARGGWRSTTDVLTILKAIRDDSGG